VSRLIGFISSSLEMVAAFGDGEEVADIAESLSDGIEAAGGPLAQALKRPCDLRTLMLLARRLFNDSARADAEGERHWSGVR
jgi:hypothetical protein